MIKIWTEENARIRCRRLASFRSASCYPQIKLVRMTICKCAWCLGHEDQSLGRMQIFPCFQFQGIHKAAHRQIHGWGEERPISVMTSRRFTGVGIWNLGHGYERHWLGSIEHILACYQRETMETIRIPRRYLNKAINMMDRLKVH